MGHEFNRGHYIVFHGYEGSHFANDNDNDMKVAYLNPWPVDRGAGDPQQGNLNGDLDWLGYAWGTGSPDASGWQGIEVRKVF